MSNQISLFRDFSYDITVVMVSYHTGAALWRSIESVLAQEGLNELILVDNGNSASTRQRLVKKNMKEPRLKVLSGHGNIGLYQGYNLGATRAKGQYVLFLSPESILPHDFLLRLVDEYKKDPLIWALSSQVLTADGIEKLEAHRSLLTPARLISEKLGFYRLFPKKYPPIHCSKLRKNFSDDALTTPNAMCLLIELDKFKQLFGFKEDYFYHYGDMDLGMRIRDLGGKTSYFAHLSVVDFRTTHKSTSLKASWYTLKDLKRYLNRHFKNEHLPGVIASLNGILNLSWAIKTFLKLPFFLRYSAKPLAQKESERCAKFLETYRDFSSDDLHIPKGTIYDLSQRVPIMLAGANTDVGLCILRRLLAADLEVIALYDKHVIDFEHPKLSWLQEDLVERYQTIYNQTPRSLIYADDICKLSNQLESFAKLGISRIVAVSSAYVFRLLSSGEKTQKAEAKSYVLAEGDVVRTSPVLHIDTTILRAGMTYGMGTDDNISTIARFIKRFGFILLSPPAAGKRQPIHCDDVAIHAIGLINHKETFGKSYNLPGDEILSYRDIIGYIFSALGKRKRILFFKYLSALSACLKPFSSVKNFNQSAVKRVNEDIIFTKEPLPEHLKLPQRSFFANKAEDFIKKT